jgi:predicted signal transduction protein with EAL and GGDEF domain
MIAVSVISRWGDEFAVLLPDVGQAQARARAVAALHAVGEPISVRDARLHVSGSFGVAMLPEHGADADELLQHADVAMYNAKAERSGVELYRSEDVRALHRRLALASDLPRAIDDNEFTMAYQLQADARTGQLVAAEALLPWRHPTYGAVSAPEAVALAERTGTQRRLTDAVLEQALLRRAEWAASGHDLTVSVNVTARDLSDAGLPGLVARLLAATATDPRALTLEITESGVMSDPARCLAVLDELAAMHVQLSVDDFGTGYSSLAYLERLPVN